MKRNKEETFAIIDEALARCTARAVRVRDYRCYEASISWLGFFITPAAPVTRGFSRYLVITPCNKRSTSSLVEMRDRIQRWLNPLETGLNSTYNGAKRIGSRHYHQVTFNYRHFQGVYFLNERLFTAAELIRVEWGDLPGSNGTPGKSHCSGWTNNQKSYSGKLTRPGIDICGGLWQWAYRLVMIAVQFVGRRWRSEVIPLFTRGIIGATRHSYWEANDPVANSGEYISIYVNSCIDLWGYLDIMVWHAICNSRPGVRYCKMFSETTCSGLFHRVMSWPRPHKSCLI